MITREPDDELVRQSLGPELVETKDDTRDAGDTVGAGAGANTRKKPQPPSTPPPWLHVTPKWGMAGKGMAMSSEPEPVQKKPRYQ